MRTVQISGKRVQDMLRDRWDELKNNANEKAMAGAQGFLTAMYAIGSLNELEVEAWQERFKRCPGHDGEGGRAWCAYCGAISPDEEPEE